MAARIESGQARSITDLAEQEGVTGAYCLAPDIVAAILDGRQPKGLRLAEMLGTGLFSGPLSEREQASAIDPTCSTDALNRDHPVSSF